MPLDTADVVERAVALNDRYRHHSAHDVLHHAFVDPQVGKVTLVSSFGAELVVLLHMVAVVDKSLPVLFLETGMLFPETLSYQQEVSARLGLTDVRLLRPFPGDADGTLHQRDTDACCDIRKTLPLHHALAGFDAWITGRKRFQGGRRAEMEFFEVEEATGRLKINPLAHWTPEDVQDYMTNNRLPRHPLVARGYPSIGCAPCTTPVAPGEDPRAGRWRGEAKDECGIHFINGKVVRGPMPRKDWTMDTGVILTSGTPIGEDRGIGDGVAAPDRAPVVSPQPAADLPLARVAATDPIPVMSPEDAAVAAAVIVTDRGFAHETWAGAIAPLAERTVEPGVDLAPDAPWPAVAALLQGGSGEVPDGVASVGDNLGEPPAMIRIAFPKFSDGRGFTLARRLRQAGYTGRLRAQGHVLADQYAMARRSGFDEVEITSDLARHQPEPQWLARAAWQAHDYQSRLGKRPSVAAR